MFKPLATDLPSAAKDRADFILRYHYPCNFRVSPLAMLADCFWADDPRLRWPMNNEENRVLD